jgi:hypothetical protein
MHCFQLRALKMLQDAWAEAQYPEEFADAFVHELSK